MRLESRLKGDRRSALLRRRRPARRRSLTAGERERYNRQLILPGWGEETQERLKRATVFIAGAGGLGSPVGLYLAAAGIGTLRICDSEAVELTNLNRQILHTDRDLGRPKVRSARRTLGRVNPFVRIVPLQAVMSESTIEELVGDAGLLVDCLDNFETRLVLNAFAVRRGLPLIHAGVTGYCGQITFLHPPGTACLACLVPQAPPKETFPILGATAGMLGCLEALEALKYLAAQGSLLRGRLLFCDGAGMQFQEVAIQKDPRCPVCGAGAARA
jgi:molybdopterin/thiamine biosynthesis adenylyltransferase